jgi:hypothetical protein
LSLGHLRLLPQVRYTYWRTTPIEIPGFFGVQSSQNQVDALLGIAWSFR